MEKKRFEIARYAYKNVPFYKQIVYQNNSSVKEFFRDKEWCQLPVIEKEDVAVKNDKLIAEPYLGLYAMDKLITAHTSGSTGLQVDVCWTEESYYKALLPLWVERWHQAGIHPKDKVCYFNTLLEDGLTYKYQKNALIISKSNLTIEKLYEVTKEIVQFKPIWMLFHPTIASMFCEMMEKQKIEIPSVRYIELTGEMVFDSLVNRIKKCFNCVVRRHYGSMEVNTIGYEYAKNQYKLFEASTYVEILDENGRELPMGEEGGIYVTSLQNRAMPIIRYGLGDTGFIEKRTTNHGEFRILHLCHARKGEWIEFLDGTSIRADILLDPIQRLSSQGEKIVYQLMAEQISKSELHITFVIDEEIEKNEFLNIYLQHLDFRVLQKLNIRFDFLPNIQCPDAQTGKMKWFNKYLGE